MPEIHLLNQGTIDKIAAGEVVERPLSVVKELTENAIDAKATAITVEIKDGGITLIRVTDNGLGIEKEQVRKAFLRHATSKIVSIEDLSRVTSLGFRGEALSSIAAVSQTEVITKTESSLTGIRYAIAGGKEEEFEEIGAPTGTTFLVRNLFFNTPVRKKFLKQPQTEGSYVADMMERLALSHPEISIKFIQNGRLRFHTSGNGNLKEVIYRIFGRDIAEALIPFEAQGSGFSVAGFLGKPEINRANRNFENYFVNGRFIKNDILTKAAEEGYRAFLMQHKFPFFVLHFSMEPSEIDVNVHPAKMEIRLIHGSELYEQISERIQKKLSEQELIPDIRFQEREEKLKQAAHLKKTAPEPFEERRAALAEPSAEYRTAPSASQAVPSEPQTAAGASASAAGGGFLQKIIGNAGNESNNDRIHANIIKANEHIIVEKPSQLNLFEDKFLSKEARSEYRILGQVFDTYWLVAFKDRLFIIDQHAAHEKVKYERLVRELSEKKVSSQMLTPPIIVTLTGREEEVLREYLCFFEEMGFEIEEFGGASYALRSMPADLYGCNEKEFFMELLDELADAAMKDVTNTGKSGEKTPAAVSVILQKLASMACKAAVKGNNSLKTEEVTALIDELLTLENPYHCPHGRPTIISMSKYELEKKFKRII
ncbi:MAG: DNA mismatch repair endonuclease MutL [Clostridium sp.]|nr:DNA mismatch repair endonuclease MutL [Clostridium sp.]